MVIPPLLVADPSIPPLLVAVSKVVIPTLTGLANSVGASQRQGSMDVIGIYLYGMMRDTPGVLDQCLGMVAEEGC